MMEGQRWITKRGSFRLTFVCKLFFVFIEVLKNRSFCAMYVNIITNVLQIIAFVDQLTALMLSFLRKG